MAKLPIVSRVVSQTISNLIDEPIRIVHSTLKSRLMYTVDVSEFRWSIKQEVLARYFKHMPRSINTYAFDNPALDNDYPKLGEKFADICNFNGTKIILIYECVENTTESDGSRLRIIMTFRTLYTQKNKDNLILFVKQLMKETKIVERKQSKNVYVRVSGRSTMEEYNRPYRSFNDTFIPKHQQDQLTKSIKKFCESEKWYRDHKLPYHFGIMLHGNPGTGKSSIVQVITSMIDCDVFYIDSDFMMDSLRDSGWIRYRNKDRMRVIIIEDIDTNSFSNKRKTNNDDIINPRTDNPRLLSISTLLNFMDGYNSIDNVIYVFTTNHLSELDPALIRPGRIDLMLEIGYVSDETFADFTKFHYGKIPDKSYHIRDKVTCAELQTKVMEGCTFEELCEMYKEVHENGKKN